MGNRYSKRDLAERFWEKVEKTEDCWNWTASLIAGGYGSFAIDGRTTGYAHIIGYELQGGVRTPGLVLDHFCNNKRCVRKDPLHLREVTERVNIRRGTSPVTGNAAKTHCKWGHPYSDENTYRVKNGSRQCRACRNRRAREAYARRKVL